jgi:hypothetical protein
MEIQSVRDRISDEEWALRKDLAAPHNAAAPIPPASPDRAIANLVE